MVVLVVLEEGGGLEESRVVQPPVRSDVMVGACGFSRDIYALSPLWEGFTASSRGRGGA